MDNLSINYVAVLVAAVAQFMVGAIWYMPLFGKTWGKIHGFDQIDPAKQKEMQKEMLPWLAVQFVMAFLTALVLAHFLKALPETSTYKLVAWVWFGFMLPLQVSAVIFGGTDSKWIAPKIAIMTGGSLLCTMVAGLIIRAMA